MSAPDIAAAPRRRWLKRSIIAMLVVANLLVFGAYVAIRGLTGQFLESVTQNEEVVAELVPVERDGPVTFLVIGSDSRETLPDDFGDFGSFGGQRADVIMLVQIDGDQCPDPQPPPRPQGRRRGTRDPEGQCRLRLRRRPADGEHGRPTSPESRSTTTWRWTSSGSLRSSTNSAASR